MCCYSDIFHRKLFIQKYGNKQWIRCWKVIQKNGKSLVSDFQYHHGTFKVNVKKYKVKYPKGFHVYLNYPVLSKDVNRRVIPVWYKVSSFIRTSGNEAVFQEIKIKKNDWYNKGSYRVPVKITLNDYRIFCLKFYVDPCDIQDSLKEAIRWLNSHNSLIINTSILDKFNELEAFDRYFLCSCIRDRTEEE